MLSLVKTGAHTIDQVRQLIEVPPAIEAALREFVLHAGKDEDAEFVESALLFRREVGRRFEELISEMATNEVQALEPTVCANETHLSSSLAVLEAEVS